jgi:pimeloyl-ACP methyl ester carboxylesterase
MAGVSLGGHVSWRMPALFPHGEIEAMFMVVSCPNLTALMLSRLGLDPSLLHTTFDELYEVPYDELVKVLDEKQKPRWPRRLHELMSEGDRKVKEEWEDDMPLLLMGGKQDPLVPVRFMEPWVEERREREKSGEAKGKLEVFVQDNTGHSCTKEMVWKMAEWLSGLYGADG